MIAALLGAFLVRGAPGGEWSCQDLYRGLSQVAVSRLFRHDHANGSKNLKSEGQRFFPEAGPYMRCCLAASYLLCSSGAVEKRVFRIICAMLWQIGVACASEIVMTDVRIFGKAQRVFSWLDKDRDHICADHSSAGRAVVFHETCRASFYRRHADALWHGLSGSLTYRIVKISLSRVRSPEFWCSRARTRGCARVESAKIRKPLIRREIGPALGAKSSPKHRFDTPKGAKTLPASSSSCAPARSTKINNR